MSFASVLLRALLSLSLILNGMSAAAAASHMPAAHVDMRTLPAAAETPPAGSEEVPCHQHEQATQVRGDDPSVATGGEGHATPDCCKSGSCRCDCVHAAQAGPLPWSEGAPAFDRTHNIRPLALAHAAPALPHLIRPPIS